MPLDHDQIVAISQDVIQRYPQALEFVGVMAAEGGSNRVEIMVTVRGCHQEPCRLLLNLSRLDQSSLQTELRRKLQTSLREHVPPPSNARSVTP
jgi:CO/xanthine dehydrogenase FAD-binding subunit